MSAKCQKQTLVALTVLALSTHIDHLRRAMIYGHYRTFVRFPDDCNILSHHSN